MSDRPVGFSFQRCWEGDSDPGLVARNSYWRPSMHLPLLEGVERAKHYLQHAPPRRSCSIPGVPSHPHGGYVYTRGGNRKQKRWILQTTQPMEVGSPVKSGTTPLTEGPPPMTLRINSSSPGRNLAPEQPVFTWNKAPWEMKAESELGGPLQPGGNIRACTHIFSENGQGHQRGPEKRLGWG